MVGGQVGDQAHAVEVVRLDAVALEGQAVGGTGQDRAGHGVGGQGAGLDFEGQRDVQTFAAMRHKARQGLGEGIGCGFDGGVLDVLSSGLCKEAVDDGRLGVRDGVADHGVAVGGRGVRAHGDIVHHGQRAGPVVYDARHEHFTHRLCF